MNEPISEPEARQILVQMHPPAASVRYTASRVEAGGWYFGVDDAEDHVGGADWIVADNGRLAAIHFSEKINDVVAALLSEDR